MPSNRVVTSIAIVFGGVLGSVAALVGPKPSPPTAPSALPFQPVSRAGEAVELGVTAAPLIPPPPPNVTAGAQGTSSVPRDSEPKPAQRDVKEAELDCANGNGRACLEAAELYGQDSDQPDPQRQRMLTGLGVQRFAVLCMQRVPLGCLELAKLHSRGHGVNRDQKASDALVDRATVICRAQPDAEGCPGAQP